MWLRFWRPGKTKEASRIRLVFSLHVIVENVRNVTMNLKTLEILRIINDENSRKTDFWLPEGFFKGLFKRLLQEGYDEDSKGLMAFRIYYRFYLLVV